MEKFSAGKRQIKLLFEAYVTPKNIIRAVAVVVAVIAVFVIINLVQKPDVSKTAIYEKDVVYVGLSSASALTEYSEETGFSGFEYDLAKTLIARTYGENKRVEFVPITSQNASYLVKSGDIDIALAMLTSGLTKTRGTLLTNAYYTEDNVVLVKKGSGLTETAMLNGKNMQMMSTEISTSSVKEALKKQGVSNDTINQIVGATSYSDAIAALEAGRIDALIMSKSNANLYKTGDMEAIASVGTTGYSIMAWTTETELIRVLNDELGRMQKDGTLQELKQKWSIG